MATRFNYSQFRTIITETMQNVNFPVFSYLKTRKRELDKARECVEMYRKFTKINAE